jgi:hypothetical protein
MQVTDVADDWPERGLRQRCRRPLPEALRRVEGPGLRELTRGAAG